MPDRTADEALSDAERKEPTGAPVVRGDPRFTGAHARQAVEFDPDDPESLAEAAAVVRAFAEDPDHEVDHIHMLRGAAACAALVRGEGSYRAAVDRAGDGVTVNFLRKWARVHDLPIAVRRHIALGDIVPSAAKHIARVDGDARYLLAWGALDHELTVDQVRTIASEVNAGDPVLEVLERHGALPGEQSVSLPIDVYHRLRRHTANERLDLHAVIVEAVELWMAHNDGQR